MFMNTNTNTNINPAHICHFFQLKYLADFFPQIFRQNVLCANKNAILSRSSHMCHLILVINAMRQNNNSLTFEKIGVIIIGNIIIGNNIILEINLMFILCRGCVKEGLSRAGDISHALYCT